LSQQNSTFNALRAVDPCLPLKTALQKLTMSMARGNDLDKKAIGLYMVKSVVFVMVNIALANVSRIKNFWWYLQYTGVDEI